MTLLNLILVSAGTGVLASLVAVVSGIRRKKSVGDILSSGLASTFIVSWACFLVLFSSSETEEWVIDSSGKVISKVEWPNFVWETSLPKGQSWFTLYSTIEQTNCSFQRYDNPDLPPLEIGFLIQTKLLPGEEPLELYLGRFGTASFKDVAARAGDTKARLSARETSYIYELMNQMVEKRREELDQLKDPSRIEQRNLAERIVIEEVQAGLEQVGLTLHSVEFYTF